MTEQSGFSAPTERQPGALAASFSIIGGITFAALMLLLHLLKPDLDPTWVPVSAYALGQYGWVMTAAFIAWGVSASGLFLAVIGVVRTLAGKIGLGFLAIAAASPLLAALFPMDAITVPIDQATVPGMIHNVSAVLSDAFPIAAALITWSLVRNRPDLAPYRPLLIIAALLTWIGAITMTASMIALLPPSGQLGPDVTIGLQNRFMVLAYAVWLVVTAWVVRHPSQRRG